MNRNQRFLVALSGTEHDAALLAYAGSLANQRIGREYRFVHVEVAQRAAAAPQGVPASDALAPRLERLIDEHFGVPPPGVLTASHILAGERVDALLEFATRSRTDVILLGHRSDRSGQRSLARRMAMIAPASVWLVPEGAPLSTQTILAPVDFSEHSVDSLEVATSLAAMTRAPRCLALHVYFDSSTIRYPEHVAALRGQEEEAFGKFLAGVDSHGIPIDKRIEEGPFPSRTILRIAQDEGVDLIVMNTRGRSRAAAVLLGSVTTQVMTESPVAVLAVKHFGAAMGLFQALKDSHFWQRPIPKSN
jgi:sulfate permease, SulP family